MRLAGYPEADRKRIVQIACQIVASQVAKGEIPETDEAIRAAVPDAIELARSAYMAAQEFLS